MRCSGGVGQPLPIPDELASVRQVSASGSEDLLLVSDSRLRLVSLSGEVRWTNAEGGDVVYFGDVCANGRDYVVIARGILESAPCTSIVQPNVARFTILL